MQSEHQQIISFIDKDFSQIEKLVAQYEDMLYNLCFRFTQSTQDAQDLYQQTWLRALEKSHVFANKSIKNWLYTICLNLYRDSYWKNRRRERLVNLRLDADTQERTIANVTDKVSAENAAMKNIQKEVLVSSIEQLSDKLRIPIVLFYFEGLDYKEIARMLRVPIGTVKSRLNIAKSKLREQMEKRRDV